MIKMFLLKWIASIRKILY